MVFIFWCFVAGLAVTVLAESLFSQYFKAKKKWDDDQTRTDKW